MKVILANKYRAKFIVTAIMLLFVFIYSTNAYCQSGKKFLWEVQSSETTVYMLGSIHLLNKDSYPLDEKIEKAYKESAIIAFETDIEEMESPKAQELLMRLALLPPGKSLRNQISNDTYELLEKRLSSVGGEFSQIERLRPWMCAFTLVMVELTKLGFDPKQGLDQYFFGKAKNDAKKTVPLETVEDQLRFFADFGLEEQDSLLRQTLKELDITEKLFKEMIDAWDSGDAEKLGSIISKSFEGYPDMYKKMITDRNLKWMNKIENLLSQNERALVVVGAGHLTGPGSLINLLTQKGFTITQR